MRGLRFVACVLCVWLVGVCEAEAKGRVKAPRVVPLEEADAQLVVDVRRAGEGLVVERVWFGEAEAGKPLVFERGGCSLEAPRQLIALVQRDEGLWCVSSEPVRLGAYWLNFGPMHDVRPGGRGAFGEAWAARLREAEEREARLKAALMARIEQCGAPNEPMWLELFPDGSVGLSYPEDVIITHVTQREPPAAERLYSAREWIECFHSKFSGWRGEGFQGHYFTGDLSGDSLEFYSATDPLAPSADYGPYFGYFQAPWGASTGLLYELMSVNDEALMERMLRFSSYSSMCKSIKDDERSLDNEDLRCAWAILSPDKMSSFLQKRKERLEAEHKIYSEDMRHVAMFLLIIEWDGVSEEAFWALWHKRSYGANISSMLRDIQNGYLSELGDAKLAAAYGLALGRYGPSERAQALAWMRFAIALETDEGRRASYTRHLAKLDEGASEAQREEARRQVAPALEQLGKVLARQRLLRRQAGVREAAAGERSEAAQARRDKSFAVAASGVFAARVAGLKAVDTQPAPADPQRGLRDALIVAIAVASLLATALLIRRASR